VTSSVRFVTRSVRFVRPGLEGVDWINLAQDRNKCGPR
jgi:hypothetical protein